MASGRLRSELRLVVLGRTGAADLILGLRAFQPQHGATDADPTQCPKHRGEVAGRQVVVVTVPDQFSSRCPPEEVRRCISSFVALSTPGPHAFVLCVPLDQPEPSHMESQALDALEKLFGPSAISQHTLVLFTHTEEVEDGASLEKHLATERQDLLELVERCGDRYHTLQLGSEEKEEDGKVEALLEKVEQAVRESGAEHFSCPLYEEAEARVRERQAEIVRKKGGTGGGEEEAGGRESPADPCLEEDIGDEALEREREEAQRSIGDLNVDVDGIFPSATVSLSPAPPSFLWGLWEKLIGWMKKLPKLVRREALLGAFVGLFVGGPFGGMLGATVGSVATEVGRRKTQKNK